MGADSAEIVVGTAQGGLYIDLLGRATQRTCPTAQRLVNEYLGSHGAKPMIVLDLTGCDWIDSTFAGWLVGLSKRLERSAGGQLCLTGCSVGCRKSLARMQLADLFQFAAIAAPAESSRTAAAMTTMSGASATSATNETSTSSIRLNISYSGCSGA